MNKSKSRRALGRGLSNLIPVEAEERGSEGNVVHIDIHSISANPFQPRQDFNEEEIASLASSIRNQGLLQPVVVRKKGDGFEIVSGERRVRAFRLLEEDKVPAIVKPLITDREMLEMALVENIQRANLNDIETAQAYQKLLLECNLSHEKLSERVGKSRSAISNTLRLLKLPSEVQKLVRSGALSMGHARALLGLEGREQQISLAEIIVREGLSVREVESQINEKAGDSSQKKRRERKRNNTAPVDPDMIELLDKLQYRFGTAVKIRSNSRQRGRVEITFSGNEDLNRILDLLLSRSEP